MRYVLKEMSEAEKPREKLIKRGVQALNDYELLAIVFRTGTKEKSALDMAIEVIASFSSVQALKEATYEELLKIKGIGLTKAVTLLACIELGRRINSFAESAVKICSPKEAFYYSRELFSRMHQEVLLAIYLNSCNEVICWKEISIGISDRTFISAKDIMRWAIKAGAYAIILAHNHPGGSSLPSDDDIIATKALKESCAALNFILIDHIIVGKNQYYSFKEKMLFRIAKEGKR